MRITQIFEQREVLSFELFPPKTEAGMEKLCGEGGVIEKLYALRPDYISCTYGAGGTNIGKNKEVLKKIKEDGRTIPVTHFTCVGAAREEIVEQLASYLDDGIDHMLALRGDLPVGWTGTRGDLRYATELVKLARDAFGDRFTISVAGSPEGHVDCRSIEADIAFLRQKQNNGADYIVTQICWDMERFKRWYDDIRKAGVTIPVSVGVLPIIDSAATIRLALSRNASVIPRELCKLISKYWIFPNVFAPEEDAESVRIKKEGFMEEGIAYTIRQIDQLRALGVGGIHLYALNRAEAVERVVRESGLMDL